MARVSPPWNKVVGPAVAVLDKVRDAISRPAHLTGRR
jgi:hypothetical protein